MFHEKRCVELSPRMTVEITAQHLAVIRPLCERDRRAVNAYEAFAIVADEGEQICLLRRIHIEVAVREEDNRVERLEVLRLPFERLLRNGRAIRAQHCVPKPGAAS